MSSLLATVIDVYAIWQTAWTAAVAGVGVSVVFALAVLGATRSSELRRDERAGLAALYGLLALAGTAATLASAVYGIVLVTTK